MGKGVLGVQGVPGECAEVRAMAVQGENGECAKVRAMGVQWLCKGVSKECRMSVQWVCKEGGVSVRRCAGGGQGEAGSRFPSWPHRSLCLLRCGSALCCLHLVPVGAGACHSQLCSLLRGSEEGAAGQKKAPACTMFALKPVPKQCFFQTWLLPFLVFP